MVQNRILILSTKVNRMESNQQDLYDAIKKNEIVSRETADTKKLDDGNPYYDESA